MDVRGSCREVRKNGSLETERRYSALGGVKLASIEHEERRNETSVRVADEQGSTNGRRLAVVKLGR